MFTLNFKCFQLSEFKSTRVHCMIYMRSMRGGCSPLPIAIRRLALVWHTVCTLQLGGLYSGWLSLQWVETVRPIVHMTCDTFRAQYRVTMHGEVCRSAAVSDLGLLNGPSGSHKRDVPNVTVEPSPGLLVYQLENAFCWLTEWGECHDGSPHTAGNHGKSTTQSKHGTRETPWVSTEDVSVTVIDGFSSSVFRAPRGGWHCEFANSVTVTDGPSPVPWPWPRSE